MANAPDRRPVGRLRRRTREWLAARWPWFQRWSTARANVPSPFVSQYLDGLKGIEIGASAHNDFGVDAINVDRFADMNTTYKQDEIKLSGRFRPVDLVAPGDDLPFKNSAVDFVLASHVIEHFPDPIRALNEWVRVARRYVVVIVPHRERTFDRDRELTPVTELVRRHAEAFTSDVDQHWTVWTRESFLEMCTETGFEVVDSQDPDDKVGNGFAVVLDASENAASGAAELTDARAGS
jgi:SAM-dependent methyltransferase